MSIRNNEERTGAKHPDVSPPIPKVQQDKPQSTFSFVVPTEFVELPSKGKYYAQDHPLHNIEVVEIRHMTAKEEDILTSRSLLKKGLAINRMLKNIIVDSKIDVDSLLVGDKNALIIASRISAYGEDYETRVTCPVCMETSDFGFNLSELDVIHNQDHGKETVKTGRNFVITLPKTKVEVGVKLLDGRDEKFLSDAIAMKKKNNLPDSNLTDQFRMFIVSVNEHTDKKSIGVFIDSMPASDSRFLRSAYEKIVPNIDMTQEFACNSCSYEGSMEVPLNADFFWPRR